MKSIKYFIGIFLIAAFSILMAQDEPAEVSGEGKVVIIPELFAQLKQNIHLLEESVVELTGIENEVKENLKVLKQAMIDKNPNLADTTHLEIISLVEKGKNVYQQGKILHKETVELYLQIKNLVKERLKGTKTEEETEEEIIDADGAPAAKDLEKIIRRLKVIDEKLHKANARLVALGERLKTEYQDLKELKGVSKEKVEEWVKKEIEQALEKVKVICEKIKELQTENLTLVEEAQKKLVEVKELLTQGNKEEALKIIVEISKMHEQGKNNYWRGRAMYANANSIYMKLSVLTKKIAEQHPKLAEQYKVSLEAIHTRLENLNEAALDIHQQMVQIEQKIKEIEQKGKIDLKKRLKIRVKVQKEALLDVKEKIVQLDRENKEILEKAKGLLLELKLAYEQDKKKEAIELILKLKKLENTARQNYWQARALYARANYIVSRGTALCRKIAHRFPELAQEYKQEFKETCAKIEELKQQAKELNKFWIKVNQKVKVTKDKIREEIGPLGIIIKKLVVVQNLAKRIEELISNIELKLVKLEELIENKQWKKVLQCGEDIATIHKQAVKKYLVAKGIYDKVRGKYEELKNDPKFIEKYDKQKLQKIDNLCQKINERLMKLDARLKELNQKYNELKAKILKKS